MGQRDAAPGVAVVRWTLTSGYSPAAGVGATAGRLLGSTDLANTSSGTRPLLTQLWLSAQTSMGGRKTSALSSATATFMPTTMPKSCNRGSELVAITRTPAIAVSALTMNARPVRLAVTSTASLGGRPRLRSSTKRNRIKLVNSVHAATTNGPPTAVIGLSFKLNAYATNDAAPTAISTGTSDSSARMMLRSRIIRKRNTNRIA